MAGPADAGLHLQSDDDLAVAGVQLAMEKNCGWNWYPRSGFASHSRFLMRMRFNWIECVSSEFIYRIP